MTKGKELAKADRGWEIANMSAEQAAEAKEIQARVNHRPQRPKLEMKTVDGTRTLLVGAGSHEYNTLHTMRVFEALGSRSDGFVGDALHRLASIVRLSGDDEMDSRALTGAMAVVGAVAPTNEMETVMALQMVAANEAALMCFERSRRADFIEHASAYSNMANKAMRSFGLHAEALAKLRRGGEQVVKHIHVNDGGQAVIADTVVTGRGAGK